MALCLPGSERSLLALVGKDGSVKLEARCSKVGLTDRGLIDGSGVREDAAEGSVACSAQ
jgi:hypothetical protein